jgi:predicted DsbA family dithiol-disulfide isomerase
MLRPLSRVAALPVKAFFLIAVLPAGSACAKKSAEVPAPASAAQPGEQAAAGNDDGKGKGTDTTPPPGVDLSKLDDFERKVFFRVLNKESSACGKPHSLLTSVRTDRSCRKSLYAARYVARLVDGGYTDSEISESIGKRFRSPRKQLDLTDAPVKGNPSAPVAVVEFVDYECPHCKSVQPVLKQLLEEYKDEVRVHFKHYPLGSHTNARAAAEAAMAAHKQGKFWVYNDRLWAIADSLTPAAMEQIARDVGLDVAKWRSDFESDAIQDRVQKDRSEGEALAISSTPTIYINGRQYTDGRDVESLKDWVNEELNR